MILLEEGHHDGEEGDTTSATNTTYYNGSNMGGLRGSQPRQSPHLNRACSQDKKVTLFRFCIDGSCDAGANREHRLRLDGQWLWNGYKNFREGQCHNMRYTRNVAKWKSLTVGTEEHDTTSENDSWFANMPARNWYSPSCGTYEIILAKQFKASKQWTSCVDTSLSGSFKGAIEGQISSSTCAEWTQPAESFIWHLKVEPVSQRSSGRYSRKFMLINPQTGKALDVARAKCNDGTNIHLWDVNRSGAQIFHYHYDSKAIVNVMCNKAVDISRFNCNDGANIWLWNRNGSGAQKFDFYNNGTIRSTGCWNKAIDIYKGERDNGTNILSWKKHGGANQKWQVKYI